MRYKNLTLLLFTFLILPSLAESKPKFFGTSNTETEAKPTNPLLPLPVYTDNDKPKFFVPSGWMGDYLDLKFNSDCRLFPQSGNSCIEIVYSAKKRNNAGWAGIFWQSPPNNWGNKKGGYNLRGAKKLVFWARGDKGGEYITEFKIGGIPANTYAGDSDTAKISHIELTKQWKRYEINLEGKNLSHIIGGFAFAISAEDNSKGFIIYLDEIVFE